MRHGGAGDDGADGVETDVGLGVLDGEGLGRVDDGRLGRVVPAQVRARADARRRRRLDEGAAFALLDQVGHEGRHGQVQRAHVDVDTQVELGIRDVDGRLVGVRGAGVVHDDVDLPVLVDGRLHHGLPVLALRGVGLDEVAAELLGRPGTALFRQVGDEHFGAFFDELRHDTFAQSISSSGHDRNFAFQAA